MAMEYRDRVKAELTQTQWSTFTQRFLPKCLNAMADGVGEREVQAVVRRLFEIMRTAHLESKPAAQEQERNVVQRV